MAHSRKRHVMTLFLKRLKLSRVIAIQGCRQSGKSYFVQHLATERLKEAKYVTFDEKAQKSVASDRPDVFLAQNSEILPLIIDEAQKVPEIFDAVKLHVDSNLRPGQYVLLGSTEFSKLLKIRESLTGRMSRLRLYTMNIAECYELSPSLAPIDTLFNSKARFTRQEFLKHLARGGLPAVFSVRNQNASTNLIRDWIDLVVHRDLQQFPGISVDSELGLEVLNQIANCDEPTASNIAKKLRKDTRVIQKILKLFEILFVLHPLPPHRLSTGKTRHYLCDVSLVSYFQGNFERQLQTWFIHEQFSQRAYRDDYDHRLVYYRTTKGSMIDLVIEKTKGIASSTAIKLITREKFDSRDFEVLRAFKRKCEQNSIPAITAACGPITTHVEHGLKMYSWESLG